MFRYISKYSKTLLNLNESNLSYEKVALMSVSDIVKIKAMEKFKEINNKDGENCSKTVIWFTKNTFGK